MCKYDGVITGFGKINGKKVAIYAQDFTVQGGSLGKVHGQKIAELIDKAIMAKCPVIGLNDSGVAIVQKLFICLCGYRNVVGFAESAASFMVDAVVCRYGHTCDEI